MKWGKVDVTIDFDAFTIEIAIIEFMRLLDRIADDSARPDNDADTDRARLTPGQGAGSAPPSASPGTRAEPPELPWAKGAARTRITSELVAEAVSAIARGYSLEHWSERRRFKGNHSLLSTLVAGTISLNGRPASLPPPVDPEGWKGGWLLLTPTQRRQLADRAMGVNETIEGLA